MKMILRLTQVVALLLISSSSSAVLGFALQTMPSHNRATTTTTVLWSQQAEYGQGTVELPDTYVKCGKCQSVYAIKEEDLGSKGRGRRLSCSVCGHSWYQSKDRIMTLRKDNFEYVPLPDNEKERIELNIKEGKNPGFVGDSRLYVGNIAFECHEDDLMDIFSTVGDVGDVSLVRDNEGKVRGFGFITMRSKDEGAKAIAELDGMEVRGRKMSVRESNQ